MIGSMLLDVAQGLAAMIGSDLPPGQSVDLGMGMLTSVADVVCQIYELVGGVGKPLIGVLPSRPGEEVVQIADNQRTEQLLGWQAQISLAAGLSQLLSNTNGTR